MTANIENENRFDSDAKRYAAYLESPEGRLRLDLPFANLREFFPGPVPADSLRALDLGGGTGAAAIRLAQHGVQVTLVDSSSKMLALAKRAIGEARLTDKVTLKQGDAAKPAEILEGSTFDIILCHNFLEFVDDPAAVLRGATKVMRNSSSILSVLVRNQAGEALKAALQLGDLRAAEQSLVAEWGQESLYGGKVRLFTPEMLEQLFEESSLGVKARRGVRIVADYLPAQISRSADYDRIFSLERQLGKRQEFFGVARYLNCLASPVTGASKEEVES
jgi:S-adenosylmethionine-dependent methyltransferase